MKIVVRNSSCGGIVNLPASKSYLHRAIIAASLAHGESVIENVTLSNDISATINAFKVLGAKIKQDGNSLIIQGIQDFSFNDNYEIDCQESGSTLRFLIPLLGLFSSSFTLKGSKSLFSRPLSVYEKIYQEQNLKFELYENHLKLDGKIKPGDFVIKGDVSSQFISGLLFYLPLLKKDSKITILPPFESESYVNLTLNTLKEFGIKIKRLSRNELIIPGNQKYHETHYKVEKDFSQFAFYAVLGAINNDLKCLDLNINSLQGDRVILDILNTFNINYEVNNDGINIHKSNEIKGSVIDLSNAIDLGPIVMVLSLFSLTPVRITNIQRLRIKESNRISAMVDNLRKFNAKIEVKENEMIIYPSKIKAPKETLNPFNDHRILMSLVVLASKVRGKVAISNPECVKKSYVNFYLDMQRIGVEIGLYD